MRLPPSPPMRPLSLSSSAASPDEHSERFASQRRRASTGLDASRGRRLIAVPAAVVGAGAPRAARGDVRRIDVTAPLTQICCGRFARRG